ncbi:hypothetical protein Taro_018328 [Colocasia esculenta]|uniref:Uncharacterized protein n=1 Tax=Colocasia esculenta TaxID=4460 RepID=A0A843UVV7_COLES|nr:hypothetical protein [Colocasia esculenta]
MQTMTAQQRKQERDMKDRHVQNETFLTIAFTNSERSECRVLTPDSCFCNPFLSVVRGGTGRCSSLTLWRVRGPGWFCLWALDLVEGVEC